MPAGVIECFLLFDSVVSPTPSRWVARNSSTAVVRHRGQKMCGGGLHLFQMHIENPYRPGSGFP